MEYDYDGSLSQQILYAYDAEGNLCSMTTLDGEGKTIALVEMSYDEQRNLIRKTFYRGVQHRPILLLEYDITYRK